MAEQYSGITWTVSELLAEVREEARISDNDRTDAQILTEATSAIWSELQSPLLLGIGESGYGIRSVDILDSAAVGRDSNEYVLPSHCTAETISHVSYYGTLTSDNPLKLSNLPLQLHDDYLQDGTTDTGTPGYWSFRSGRLLISPIPSSTSSGYVRIFYQRRHPKLVVALNNVDLISDIDVSNLLITCNTAVPTNWPTFGGEGEADIAADIYSVYGPHRYLVTDLVITNDASDPDLNYAAQVDISAVAEVPTTLGAYIALAGTSAHVHLPPEFRKPLNLRTASYVLRQIGDETRANSMLGEYRNIMQAIQNNLMPRAKNAPQRIINPNSPLRRGGGRRRNR